MVDKNAKPDGEGQSGSVLESLVHCISREDLLRAAADPGLTEDLALALLGRSDLPAEVIEQVARNGAVLKSRKVRYALAGHPHTPRYCSVPLIRQLHSFDLMKIALVPSVPADVKAAADDALVARLKTLTIGERLTLARRGSGRIASVLLLDTERRVMEVALENARLTEALIVKAVLRPNASAVFIQAVAHHRKWSFRREVRIALLCTEHVSLARALEFRQGLSEPFLRELMGSSHLPAHVKEHLLRVTSDAQDV